MKRERREYEGHRIEVRGREGQRELLIDDVPVRYGQLPNGQYFLHDYAYDWTDNLTELAQKFIDYRRRADMIRQERGSEEEG
jgi:hypothetical protein